MLYRRLCRALGIALLALAAVMPALPVLTAPLDLSPVAIIASSGSRSAFLFGLLLAAPTALLGAVLVRAST